MFGTLNWRFALFPFWPVSTGADRAVATPRWKDLVGSGAVDPAGLGWDLVHDVGAVAGAGGQILHLFGQVLDYDGEPVEDVTVEIWQNGLDGCPRYDGKTLLPERDPTFAGYGAARTNRFGGYRFRTILPAGCEACPPHIDARLRPYGGRVLATRLYLLDDPRNHRDWHFAALGPSRQAAVMLDPVQRPDGEWEAGFNFVI